MPGLAPDEQPAEWALVAYAQPGGIVARAEELARGERGQVGAVAFAGVVDGVAVLTERLQELRDVGDGGARAVDGVSQMSDVPVL